MIIIKTTLSSFNCLQIFENHKKKKNNKTRRETQWDHQSAVPPQQTRLPAFACLPSLPRCYLHTHDTFQAINQARSRAQEKERETKQKQSKRYRWIGVEIYFPSICVGETALKRSRGRDISRAYWITARIRKAEGESERERGRRRGIKEPWTCTK